MNSSIALTTHALVLAAGAGSRMSCLPSDSTPKALLPIANRPMLFYSLFSLARAGVPSCTVFVPADRLKQIRTYVNDVFPNDKLVEKLPCSLKCDVRVSAADSGTADAVRYMAPSDAHATSLIVLSSDYVGDIDLSRVLQHHYDSLSTATVALIRQPCHPPPQKAKQKGKASKKSSSSSSSYTVTNYALLSDRHRLLGLMSPSDLTSNKLVVRAALTNRYDSITLCSDVFDTHVYVLDKRTVRNALRLFPAISSVRFDLIPYLARRQHTLQRTADTLDWPYPGEELVVNALVLDVTDTYAKRVNTVTNFLDANIQVASGCLNAFLDSSAKVAEKPKKGKKMERKLPFATAGEMVSVSPDSKVAENVTAGDRTSVKKSVVGPNCKLASNVKINGCVLMANVTLEEGVNLSSCIVCEDAVVQKGSTLKECQVAASVAVPPDSEANGKHFTGVQEDLYGLDNIEFF
ncbi:Translation initiation factor eIF2B subunit gamma [Gracilaria domingensis]|nr:Translation initiation factor eIF2B subunit gamma [Gracilaria domingensis]